MTGFIHNKFRHFFTITLAAVVTVVTAPWNASWAQSEDLALEEVMVTAQKREQSMQDVPYNC
jgi:hypothetical protein